MRTVRFIVPAQNGSQSGPYPKGHAFAACFGRATGRQTPTIARQSVTETAHGPLYWRWGGPFVFLRYRSPEQSLDAPFKCGAEIRAPGPLSRNALSGPSSAWSSAQATRSASIRATRATCPLKKGTGSERGPADGSPNAPCEVPVPFFTPRVVAKNHPLTSSDPAARPTPERPRLTADS